MALPLVGEDDVPGLACLALPHGNHAGISVEIRNVPWSHRELN
jgi:hypothetical protein